MGTWLLLWNHQSMSMLRHMNMPFSSEYDTYSCGKQMNSKEKKILWQQTFFFFNKMHKNDACFNKVGHKCLTRPHQPLLQYFLQNIPFQKIGTKIKIYFCKELQEQKLLDNSSSIFIQIQHNASSIFIQLQHKNILQKSRFSCQRKTLIFHILATK